MKTPPRKDHENNPKHPAVRDVDGRRYTEDGRGGWIPDDDPDATPLTFPALLQNVDGGELHVDHGDRHPESP